MPYLSGPLYLLQDGRPVLVEDPRVFCRMFGVFCGILMAPPQRFLGPFTSVSIPKFISEEKIQWSFQFMCQYRQLFVGVLLIGLGLSVSLCLAGSSCFIPHKQSLHLS